MITLHFKDRTEITSQEAAALLRKERQLGTGSFYNEKRLRCLYGVLEDYGRSDGPGRLLTVATSHALSSKGLGVPDNDAFVGTPEERCEHFAQLFEQL